MIAPALGVVVGLVLGGLLWVLVEPSIDVPALRRANHRGVELTTAAGVVVPLTLVLVAALLRFLQQAAAWQPTWDQLVGPSVTAALGFGLFGLVDDVAGVGESGGFRHHVRTLLNGRITTGMLKLVGGAAVALLTSAALSLSDGGLVGMLRDAAVVALAANGVNLFDRRAGRSLKMVLVGFVAMVLWSRSPSLTGPAVGVGAGLALLPSELRERSMLGDTGANALGALLGLSALAAFPGPGSRWVLLVGLLALNVGSEFVSYSRVIEAVPPLRFLDRLGRSADDAG